MTCLFMEPKGWGRGWGAAPAPPEPVTKWGGEMPLRNPGMKFLQGGGRVAKWTELDIYYSHVVIGGKATPGAQFPSS